MLDISFIIVSWNAKKYLVNCLKSIEETIGNYKYEVIVVDNASSDGSPDEVEHLFPKMKVIRENKNLGFAKANNVGIQQSSGRYLFLVNSDVIIKPDCIKNLVSFMDLNPTTGLAGPLILNPDDSLQPSCRRFPTLLNSFSEAFALNTIFPKVPFFAGTFMNKWEHKKTNNVNVLSGCFWVVRRSALDDVGGLDEKFFIYAEDVDWCKRFNLASWGVTYFPGAEAIHFGGASSSNAPVRFFIEMHKANLQYWRKYHNLLSQIAYSSLKLLHMTLRIIGYTIMYLIKPANKDNFKYKIKRSLAFIRYFFSIPKIESQTNN